MKFREGDPVMHWTYGLGQVVRIEEREISGSTALYYAVKMGALTVWVPADENIESRLRTPTSPAGFKKLLAILAGPGEKLPDDRRERKTRLLELLKDGRAQSLCRIVRDLSQYRSVRALNENDQAMLKQAQGALLGEWGYSLSMSPAQTALEFHRVLAVEPEENVK
jgi:RNA polymerase-interacting CarD/CdnL/TRCF family regulator